MRMSRVFSFLIHNVILLTYFGCIIPRLIDFVQVQEQLILI